MYVMMTKWCGSEEMVIGYLVCSGKKQGRWNKDDKWGKSKIKLEVGLSRIHI